MSALFLLLAGHYVVDFALQTDWLARNKSPFIGHGIWPHVMTAHAFMQGLSVYLVTQSLGLAVAELVAHWLIDVRRCQSALSFNQDQFLHLFCRCLWAGIFMLGAA